MARKTSLTENLAKDLEALWQLSGEDTLTDVEIAARLGIKYNTLINWLRKNSKYLKKNGEKSDGLKQIRERAKATTKSSYLQRLYGLLVKAETAGDLKGSASMIQWLLEKQFPGQFGNRLNLSGSVNTRPGLEDLTDEQLNEQLSKDLGELTKRPECQKVMEAQLKSLTG